MTLNCCIGNDLRKYSRINYISKNVCTWRLPSNQVLTLYWKDESRGSYSTYVRMYTDKYFCFYWQPMLIAAVHIAYIYMFSNLRMRHNYRLCMLILHLLYNRIFSLVQIFLFFAWEEILLGKKSQPTYVPTNPSILLMCRK